MTDSIETEAPTTLLGTIGDMAKAGAGFLAALLARIVGGIQGAMLALPLVLGCQSKSDAADKPAPAAETLVEKPKPTVEEGPRKLGLFSITFYYVTNEEEVLAQSKRAAAKAAAANDNVGEGEAELAAVVPPEMVTVYAKKCEPLAEVTREFAQQLRIQGTGRLKDGRVLNVAGPCNCGTSPCYKEISHQWGTAGSGRSLVPFRTVAVDPKLIKLGSLLYVPLLEGRTMPGRGPYGGFVHDGCVVADDTGGGIKDHQLDLFVGKKAWYLGMSASGSRGSHSWARHVPVYDGAKICERKGRKVARKSGAS